MELAFELVVELVFFVGKSLFLGVLTLALASVLAIAFVPRETLDAANAADGE